MAPMQKSNYKDNINVDIMVLVDLLEAEVKKFENEVYDIAFEIEMGIDISPIIKSKAQYEY
ncbi:MAG: hypothetical protein NC412_04530 [Roseburia sp.]|nr:hypothetical protein [Roseburia sp.]MCM1279676.1 hypothetical protein [Robinsoniella sp.]